MKHKPTDTHNYIPKAHAFLQGNKLPPNLSLLTIAHDDWCDFVNQRGFCNCNPDFQLRHPPRNQTTTES